MFQCAPFTWNTQGLVFQLDFNIHGRLHKIGSAVEWRGKGKGASPVDVSKSQSRPRWFRPPPSVPCGLATRCTAIGACVSMLLPEAISVGTGVRRKWRLLGVGTSCRRRGSCRCGGKVTSMHLSSGSPKLHCMAQGTSPTHALRQQTAIYNSPSATMSRESVHPIAVTYLQSNSSRKY